MADSHQDSLCCGGGGGRIWMDTPQDERFSDLRLHQAKESGAEVLATACPYCITNFEESRLNLEFEDILEVKDIAEIVSEVSTKSRCQNHRGRGPYKSGRSSMDSIKKLAPTNAI